MRNIDVIQTDTGIYVEDQHGEMIPVDCQWFAACETHAATTEPHPILGDVPICTKHAAWCREMEK